MCMYADAHGYDDDHDDDDGGGCGDEFMFVVPQHFHTVLLTINYVQNRIS